MTLIVKERYAQRENSNLVVDVLIKTARCDVTNFVKLAHRTNAMQWPVAVFLL